MSKFTDVCGNVAVGGATGAAAGGSIGAAIGAVGGPVTSGLGATIGGAIGCIAGMFADWVAGVEVDGKAVTRERWSLYDGYEMHVLSYESNLCFDWP